MKQKGTRSAQNDQVTSRKTTKITAMQKPVEDLMAMRRPEWTKKKGVRLLLAVGKPTRRGQTQGKQGKKTIVYQETKKRKKAQVAYKKNFCLQGENSQTRNYEKRNSGESQTFPERKGAGKT